MRDLRARETVMCQSPSVVAPDEVRCSATTRRGTPCSGVLNHPPCFDRMREGWEYTGPIPDSIPSAADVQVIAEWYEVCTYHANEWTCWQHDVTRT